MLAQISQLEPSTLAVVGGLVVTHLGSIIGGYLSIRDRLTRIETKLDMHENDLDGFGKLLETERSRGLKAP